MLGYDQGAGVCQSRDSRPSYPPGMWSAHRLSIPIARYLPTEGMGHDLPPEPAPTVIEAICELANLRDYVPRG